MTGDISLDGRTVVAVENEAGTVSAETRFRFEQDGERPRASYSGGAIAEGFLVGTFDGRRWDVRYVQLTEDGETETGHSVGDVELLEDGRVRVEDEWESRDGSGQTVLEGVER